MRLLLRKCVFALFVFGFSTSYAQLNPGDLVFTGYNADEPSKGFSFVSTTTITAATVIHFTDKGWLTTDAFRDGEGILSYTVPAGGLSKGDQVAILDTFSSSNSYYASDGGSIASLGSVNPSASGDQFFAFSGTVTSLNSISSISLIAGLHYRTGSFDADATSTNHSSLPSALTLGTNAVVMSAHRDNGRLQVTASSFSGTAASIQTYACNNSNWDTDNSIVYSLPPNAENSWNGSVWSTGSNPTSSEHAIISAGQTLTVSSSLTAGEVTIETGSTISINDSVSLTVSGGDFTNSGTLSGTGTLAFSNNGNTSNIRGSAVSFEGVVDVASGTTLETNDLLTLTASSATSYGMLSGTGTFSGNVAIQCYLDLAGGASDGRYYQLASPITNTTFTDINEGQILNVSSGGTGSVWQWDASNSNWAAPTSAASTMENGRGYAVYAGSNANGDFVRAEAGTIELNGTVTTSDVAFALSYNDGQALNVTFVGGTAQAATEGWNLMGNPYASQYNWSGQTRPSGLNDAIYINQGTASFATYVSGVGTNNGTQYIAPFQAFWVQSTSATPGSLTFATAQRVASESTELFKTVSVDGVHLEVFDILNQKDEIFVGFDADASLNFDADYDAWKFVNAQGFPSIYSKIANNSYAINRVGNKELSSFNIGLEHVNDLEQLTIHLDKSQLTSYATVKIEDLKTSVLHDFANGDYILTNDTSFGADRFVLHFSDVQNVGIENPDLFNWYAYEVEGGIQVKAPDSKNARIEVYDMASRLVASEDNFSKETFVSISRTGVFVIRLIENNNITNFKIILNND